MNLSSLKKEKEELYAIDPESGEGFIPVSSEASSEAVEKKPAEKKPAEKKPAEKLWSDVDGKRTYHFSEKDIETAVSCFIKRGARFSKMYEMNGLSVVFQAVTDKEQAELNELLQLIENKGAVRWKKTTQEYDAPDSAPVEQRVIKFQTETQDIVHQDSSRAMRTATLAFYITKFCGDSLIDKSIDQKADILEEYPSDLLDWVFYNPYLHFRGLLLEAMKRFSAF